MIFGNIKNEAIAQVNDKVRVFVGDTFISPDEAAITLVEIEPESGAGFYDVTNADAEKLYLDWAYTTNGSKAITLRITTDSTPVTFSSAIEVLSVAEDKLFSSDSDLLAYEDDIMRYVSKGRSSHLDKHRAAQDDILKRLDEMNIVNTDGSRLTKSNIYDLEDVQNWSKYLVLSYIFESVSNAVDDVFSEKASKYRIKANAAENRSRLRLDLDGDGEVDGKVNLTSFDMVRQ